MTSLRRLAVLGLVLLVAASLLMWGQDRPPLDRPGRPGGSGRPGGPGGPPDLAMGFAGRVLHELDLSQSQKRQIHELVRSHIDGELRSLIRGFGEARLALENLVWDPAASDKDVAAAGESLSRASLALERGRRRLASDVLGALDATQRRKFHEMLAAARPPMPPGPPVEDPDGS